MEKVVLNSMFENLLHIWNKESFWNSKMRPYIYWSVNGVHVINLLKTYEKIEKIKKELQEAVKSWKKILFVGTKMQSKDFFKDLALKTGNYYVSDKWIPWLLTNFRTIKKRIETYNKLLRDSENWSFDVLTKKEKAQKMLILSKLDRAFAWLRHIKKLPDIVFVSDWVYEKQALKEAMKLGIHTYAILNTNWDIDLVKDFIPANTNSVKSFDFITSELIKDLAISSWSEDKVKLKKVVEKRVSWEKTSRKSNSWKTLNKKVN